MSEYKGKFGVSILSYCLMSNHFHFLLKQETDLPITAFMLRLSTSYAKYFNIKYKEVGSLFQGRFKAKLVETDEYLLHLSRYIHRNPISTPGVELTYFPWSSYSAYIEGGKNDFVDPNYILGYFAHKDPQRDYRQFTEYETNNEDELLAEFSFGED